MAQGYQCDTKVYITENLGKLSITDMLDYFEQRGAMRVSDLHIKIGAPPTYRIDGDLVKLRGEPVNPETAKQLIYPLLSDENLKKFQNTFNIDCSYRVRSLQFRINVFKENDGISGAGKSTTIASLIDRISEKTACRIISVEDPIEYVYPQKYSIISQREVGRDVNTFSDGLRAMMREDPDIIFVGEMRDPETITMTLTAAETGHLVFSTLHTRDATGSVTRILDYFPPTRQNEVRNQLSLGLSCIVSQKLIPKKDASGRIVAMEILNNNYAVANLIRTGKIEQIYSQLQTKTRDKPDEKMIAMDMHLAQLVKEDKVDLLEAKKWANNINCFVDAMKRQSP